MSYNKARAEKEWLRWKEADEKRMRQVGVNENLIQQIRASDWEQFKSDRRFYERFQETDTYIEQQTAAADESHRPIWSVDQLLAEIDNEHLRMVLLSVDKLTLQIVIYKMAGYTTKEIAKGLRLTTKAVYRRLDRLKENIEKIL